MDRMPNFLVVGAAKSGTSSLYHYLVEHPEIFIPERKECRFFSGMAGNFRGPGDDEVNCSIIRNFASYQALFASVSDAKALGDVSPDYLYYYDRSIQNIVHTPGMSKDVHIVIVLRDPVERAFSQYLHFLRDGREYLSFREALNHEEERRRNHWEWAWRYQDVGLYYNQVKAYLETFRRVKIYLFDDLRDNCFDLLKDLYQFLGVSPSFVPADSKRYNASEIPRSKLLHKIMVRENWLKRLMRPLVRGMFSDKSHQRLIDLLYRLNLYKPSLDPDLREELKKFYRPEVLKLQDLIKRDLRVWLD